MPKPPRPWEWPPRSIGRREGSRPPFPSFPLALLRSLRPPPRSPSAAFPAPIHGQPPYLRFGQGQVCPCPFSFTTSTTRLDRRSHTRGPTTSNLGYRWPRSATSSLYTIQVHTKAWRDLPPSLYHQGPKRPLNRQPPRLPQPQRAQPGRPVTQKPNPLRLQNLPGMGFMKPGTGKPAQNPAPLPVIGPKPMGPVLSPQGIVLPPFLFSHLGAYLRGIYASTDDNANPNALRPRSHQARPGFPFPLSGLRRPSASPPRGSCRKWP